MSEIITIYEPDNFLKKGYLSIFSEIYNGLEKSKWLTYQLLRRDFFAVYKQSFIGALWALIIPGSHNVTYSLGVGFSLSLLNGVMRELKC